MLKYDANHEKIANIMGIMNFFANMMLSIKIENMMLIMKSLQI